MFRCRSAPQHKAFPTSLSEWGFTISDGGEFVDANGEYFNYFATDNERYNDMRHEACQVLAREAIAKELRTKYDIQELFLSGDHGATISTNRPDGRPHVSILSTEVSKLKHKRDVIVVVGETGQDAGIWAWRYVQRQGGMVKGSAVGLAAELEKSGQWLSKWMKDGVEGVDEQMEALRLNSNKYEEFIPGIIILNPGQLLYSPQLNKNLSLVSWSQRPGDCILGDAYNIDPKHNIIPGHEDPYRHLHTTFEHVLQQILSPDEPRLHILTIGDGSDPTLDVLDQILLNKPELQVRGGTLASIALVGSRHDPTEFMSSALPAWLATVGKAWVASEQKKGKLLDLPTGMRPKIGYAQGERSGEVDSTLPDNSSLEAPPTNAAIEKSSNDESASQDLARKDSVLPSGESFLPTIEDPDDIVRPEHDPVSCPTFSAGIEDGIVETVFPAVMPDCVAYFITAIEAARVEEAREGRVWPKDMD